MRNRKTLWIIAIAIGVLFIGSYIYLRAGAGKDVEKIKKCPVNVAYTDTSIVDRTVILLYDNGSGTRSFVQSDKSMFSFTLLGYEEASGMCIGAWDDFENDGWQIVKIGKGTDSTIKLADVYPNARIGKISLANNMLIVPALSHGEVVLSYYNLNGLLIKRLKLHIPGDKIKELLSPVDVASNGQVAVALVVESIPIGGVYLFEKDGSIKKRLGNGRNPCFDPSGKKIAYNYEAIRYSETGSKGTSSNKIIIYDIKTGTRYTINAFPSSKNAAGVFSIISEGIVIGTLQDLLSHQWSPDGKWLICSYSRTLTGDRALFGVSVNVKNQQWCRLPIYVEDNNWCVVSMQ